MSSRDGFYLQIDRMSGLILALGIEWLLQLELHAVGSRVGRLLMGSRVEC